MLDDVDLSPFAFVAVLAPLFGGVLCGVVSLVSRRRDDGARRGLADALAADIRKRPLDHPGVVEVVWAPASPVVVRVKERAGKDIAPFVDVRLAPDRFTAALAPAGVVLCALDRAPSTYDLDDARAFVDAMVAHAHTLRADVLGHAVGAGGSSVAIPA